VTHGLSNGLTESVNTKLRLLTRIAYGFRNTDNFIALCLSTAAATAHPYPAAPSQSDRRIGTKMPLFWDDGEKHRGPPPVEASRHEASGC
jgi:hypothetical protein